MNLHQISSQFKTERDFHYYLFNLRWPNGIRCTFCGSTNVHFRTTSVRLKCNDCNKSFSATSGTVLHNTKLPLGKWFMAISVILSAKKGISSLQLSRTIGVNKNTAWFMQMRLRKAMKEDGTLGGLIKLDSLPNINASYPKSKNIKRKRGLIYKTSISDLIKSNRIRVRRNIADNCSDNSDPELVNNVVKTRKASSDHLRFYYGVGDPFRDHSKLNSGNRQSNWLSNNSETTYGFYSIFKRAVIGQYHKLSYRHLESYLDEINFKTIHYGDNIFDQLLTRCLSST